MEKKLIALVFIALLAGLGGGYGLGYVVYQPQIIMLQTDLSNLQDVFENLNTTYNQLGESYNYLNSSYNELKTRIDSFNASLIDLNTSLKLDQPEFVILDALPEEQISKVRVIVWNIGGKDAHDVLISYNLTAIGDDWIKLIGSTTVLVLKAGEIGRFQVPWTVIRQVSNADVILHIEVSISCAEGVTKQDVVEHPNRWFGFG